VGRLVMLSNGCYMNVDVPPFFISMSTNHVTQLNAVGLRRSGMSQQSINGIRQAFQIIFRGNKMIASAIESMSPELLAVPEVAELVEFCKETKRGVARFKAWSQRGTEGTNAEQA